MSTHPTSPDSKKICFLWEYNWESGTLVSEGPKNFKIFFQGFGFTPHTRIVPKEKCALPNELVCIIWETWKGVNGRGAYRVERSMYSQHRILAQNVARQSWGAGRCTEDQFGALRP